MSYRTAQVDPDEAATTVLQVWRENWARSDRIEDTYRWYYTANPLGRGTCFVLTKASDAAPEVFAGSTGVGKRSFCFDGRPRSVGLFGDFFVHKSHRSLFPALILQRAAQTWAVENNDLVYGFPNKLAIGVFRRLGFAELGRMTRYVRVLQHAPYLRRMIDQPIITRPAGMMLDVAQELRYGKGSRLFPGRTKIERIDRVDARFDELFDRAKVSFNIIGERNAAFLRWRFKEKPDDRSVIWGLIDRMSGKLDGYAVIQRTDKMANLRDVLAGSTESLRRLLVLLCTELRKEGFQSASFAFLGSSKVVDVLAESGFHARESERVVIWRRGQPKATSDIPQESFFADRNRWYITDADEDQ